MTNFFFQPPFVNGTDLLGKNHRIFRQSVLDCIYFDMRGQFGFIKLTGNRRSNDRGTVFVAHIVLNNKYGSYAALF